MRPRPSPLPCDADSYTPLITLQCGFFKQEQDKKEWAASLGLPLPNALHHRRRRILEEEGRSCQRGRQPWRKALGTRKEENQPSAYRRSPRIILDAKREPSEHCYLGNRATGSPVRYLQTQPCSRRNEALAGAWHSIPL
ncbi:hypothetical protein NDU88_009699 [Pleurodeles waltl]|uniref:Uncharacterized protein n=1 Tax=Pleurodeles waltl TaxID=8319 RepID=A0AAV7RYE2_PLEWA|nr:hypothetical protein NDU88_009699 [Pleurodeles waltl]